MRLTHWFRRSRYTQNRQCSCRLHDNPAASTGLSAAVSEHVPILSLNSSVYQKGVGKPAVLSVAGIPTIQRTLGPEANGLIVDLQLTLFSLLVPDLDGIPVAQRVRSVDVASVDAAPLLTFSEEHSCWPKLANVPSFDGRAKKVKDLCVAQIIGLLQFRQVPGHPRNKCPERALSWGICKGKWKTTTTVTWHEDEICLFLVIRLRGGGWNQDTFIPYAEDLWLASGCVLATALHNAGIKSPTVNAAYGKINCKKREAVRCAACCTTTACFCTPRREEVGLERSDPRPASLSTARFEFVVQEHSVNPLDRSARMRFFSTHKHVYI